MTRIEQYYEQIPSNNSTVLDRSLSTGAQSAPRDAGIATDVARVDLPASEQRLTQVAVLVRLHRVAAPQGQPLTDDHAHFRHADR